MKKIELLVVLLIIISCSGKEKDTTERTIHNIEFLNWQLPIPKKYARITFDQYQIIIKESYDDSTYVAMRINQIEKSKNMFGNYAMICDTLVNHILLIFMLRLIASKAILISPFIFVCTSANMQ